MRVRGRDGAESRHLRAWYAAVMDWREHIVLDPEICHGKPTFRGTRVMVAPILGHLAAGESLETVCREYPSLTELAVRAALAFASEVIAGEQVMAT